MPAQLAAPCEQCVTELDRLEEPLTARHDFEGPIAFLVELDGVRDRFRIADEIAALLQLVDNPGACFRRGKAGEVVVEALRSAGIDRLPPGRPPFHGPDRA